MIKCENCGKEFSSYDSLKQHHSAKHSSLAFNAPTPVTETESQKGRAVMHEHSRRGRKGRKRVIVSVVLLGLVLALGYYSLTSFGAGEGDTAAIGQLGSAHTHPLLALYLDNQQTDLAQNQYQLKDKYAHFEDGDGTTLHLHATGISLKYVISTLGVSYDPGKVIVTVSGQQSPEGLNYKPSDGDEISVWLFSPSDAVLSNQTVGLSVGNLAPDFSLRDSDGRIVTRDSLKVKPTFIFFTTTWCVPCQVGAKELLKYDLETGGDAFNVLIVFVDLRETEAQIREWKASFGGEDWFTALDTTGMADTYQVRYLDTKFVLDSGGVIRWDDIYPLEYGQAKNVLQPLIG